MNCINLIKNKIDIVEELYKKLVKDDIFALSAQMAYPIIVSIIPTLMFILSLAGASEPVIAYIYSTLRFILPKLSFDIIDKILKEVLYVSNFSYAVLFSTIYFISIGIRGVMKGVNKAYGVEESRNIFLKFILSFLFAILFAFAIFLSFIVLVFGDLIIKGFFVILNINMNLSIIYNILRFIFSYFILGFIFCLIYISSVNIKLKFKDVYKGAYFSCFLWIIVCLAFGFYVNNFSKYSILFGSLGGFFVLLVWTYISSFIILLGGEINAITYKKEKHS